jgi:hypothetical protein
LTLGNGLHIQTALKDNIDFETVQGRGFRIRIV